MTAPPLVGCVVWSLGVIFICYLMRISRWFELSVDRVCQELEVTRNADANKTSGELGFVLRETLVEVS